MQQKYIIVRLLVALQHFVFQCLAFSRQMCSVKNASHGLTWFQLIKIDYTTLLSLNTNKYIGDVSFWMNCRRGFMTGVSLGFARKAVRWNLSFVPNHKVKQKALLFVPLKPLLKSNQTLLNISWFRTLLDPISLLLTRVYDFEIFLFRFFCFSPWPFQFILTLIRISVKQSLFFRIFEKTIVHHYADLWCLKLSFCRNGFNPHMVSYWLRPNHRYFSAFDES